MNCDNRYQSKLWKEKQRKKYQSTVSPKILDFLSKLHLRLQISWKKTKLPAGGAKKIAKEKINLKNYLSPKTFCHTDTY